MGTHGFSALAGLTGGVLPGTCWPFAESTAKSKSESAGRKVCRAIYGAVSHGWDAVRKGFNSTTRMPARINAAPAMPRCESTSPASRYDVSQAKTGSIEKISTVRVGLDQRCAQVWIEKANAVASRLVTARATHTLIVNV